MYQKFITIFIFSILIVGCSQKHNQYSKPTDIVHEQALTLTQNAIVKDGTSTKAFVVVTHLNKIDHELIEKNEEIEKFLVSVYIPNEKELYKKIDFSVNSGQKYTVTSIDKNDEILKILPGSTSWNQYFLVETSRNDKKRGIIFKVSIGNYSPVGMNFLDAYGNLPYAKARKIIF